MTDQTPTDPQDETLTAEQQFEVAKRQQYAQTTHEVSPGLGKMGGAGASAIGPDIAEQSNPETNPTPS